MQMAMTAANKGLRRFRPAKSDRFSASKPRRDKSKITPKVPSVVST